MTTTRQATLDALQPVDCVNYRLRRAARVAARAYDDALKPSGLRNTQFTLLGALDWLGETSIGDLSEELAIDGTTLTRNLEVLIRRGLVENITVDDARVRNVRLTGAGKRTYDKAVPLWSQAQQRVVENLGQGRWQGMAQQLRKIEQALGGTD